MTFFRTTTIFFLAAISITQMSTIVRGETLRAFVGSVSRPPMEESVALFREETGINVQITYGGSGGLLSQLILGRRGDIYIPASPDFMEKAIAKGVVERDAEVKLAYILPAILVQAGNPKEIKGLLSLKEKGMRVAIPNPRTVSSGIYAVELIEENSLAGGIRPNIVTYSESYGKALNLVALKAVDAVLGWQQIPQWSRKKIEAIPLGADEIHRVAYISAAVTSFTQNPEGTERFLSFLTSERVRAIFKKHGFLTTETEIKKVAPKARIGGQYKLPEGW